MKKKALVLFSGGLDSLLAVKVLEEQDFEITAICFVSNFFDEQKAKIVAEKNNIKLRIIDIHKNILDLVKKPINGYGKNLNPCIDCHSTMIRYAGDIALKENFCFIASGEVLGQRPFSQNKEALEKIKKITGIDVLRPLSAKCLAETEVEKNGVVDREKLYDIKGRTRSEQQKLIEKFKITDYNPPAGGCILTDAVFCQRLKKMLDYWPDCSYEDVELLKNGRVYWFSLEDEKILTVIGRHKEDNKILEKLKKENDFFCKLKDSNGPTTLIRFLKNKKIDKKVFEKNIPENIDLIDLDKFDYNCSDLNDFLNKISLLTGFYFVKARGKNIKIEIL